VACCLGPAYNSIRKEVLSKSPDIRLKKPAIIQDDFEFCRAICRTSSKSLVGVNRYRSDEKYCFGLDGPEINMTTKAIAYKMKITNRDSEYNKEKQKQPNNKNEMKIRIVGDEDDVITFKSLINDDQRGPKSAAVTMHVTSLLLIFLSPLLLILCSF